MLKVRKVMLLWSKMHQGRQRKNRNCENLNNRKEKWPDKTNWIDLTKKQSWKEMTWLCKRGSARQKRLWNRLLSRFNRRNKRNCRKMQTMNRWWQVLHRCSSANKQVSNYRYWEQTPLQRAVLPDPHLKRCLKRLQVLPVIKMIRPLYKNRTLLLNHKRRHSRIEDWVNRNQI